MAEKGLSKEVTAKIIARAWKDPAFKQKLLTNPRQALKEFGVNVPVHVTLNIFESSDTSWYLILPPQPAQAKTLTETELEKLAAASRPQEQTPDGRCAAWE